MKRMRPNGNIMGLARAVQPKSGVFCGTEYETEISERLAVDGWNFGLAG